MEVKWNTPSLWLEKWPSLDVSKRFLGWRGSLNLLCLLSWVLAIPTLVITILLWINGGIDTDGSVTTVTIRSGPCGDIDSADTWIHLVMNILSSSLLASTNFLLQTWAAPKRADVDKAHRIGDTVEIGVPSFHNMVKGRPIRLVFWVAMFLVALPIHLVFNSAVYKTAALNSLGYTVVAPEYARRTFQRISNDSNIYTNLRDPRPNNEWEELPIRELFDKYYMQVPTTFRHAVVIADHVMGETDPVPDTDTILDQVTIESTWLPVTWDIPLSEGPSNLSNVYWEGIGLGDQYQLHATGFSEKFEPECRLLANPMFWSLTAVCNLAIALTLTGVAYFHKSNPLITVGDAIDSFLTRPTELIPKSASTYDHTAFTNMFRPQLVARTYNTEARGRGWWQGVSLTRWWLTSLWFCLMTFALLVSFFGSLFEMKALQEIFSDGLAASISKAMRIFGKYETPNRTTEFLLVAIANSPQVLTSLTCLYYNIILTTMVAEREWQRIGQPGRSSSTYLRASTPRGSQRGSYFLSLPYRYGIPLLVITTAEKWLASLGLFYINLDFWDSKGVRMTNGPSVVMLGYSSMAVFYLIIVTAVSWLAIVLLGITRSYPAGKPLLGSCSGVIAASCHLSAADVARRDAGEDLAAGPLSWGVIRQVNKGGEQEQWLGFTTGEEAEMPKDGEVYG